MNTTIKKYNVGDTVYTINDDNYFAIDKAIVIKTPQPGEQCVPHTIQYEDGTILQRYPKFLYPTLDIAKDQQNYNIEDAIIRKTDDIDYFESEIVDMQDNIAKTKLYLEKLKQIKDGKYKI